jgi:hypothetical protein
MITDRLTDQERAAVELALDKTFAQTDEERLAAELAIWRAMHIDSNKLQLLAHVGVKAIHDERARQQRLMAVRAKAAPQMGIRP